MKTAALFVFNCLFNSIKDTQAGDNKTSSSALNRGAGIVLEEGPLRIFQQEQDYCNGVGGERYTKTGGRTDWHTLN